MLNLQMKLAVLLFGLSCVMTMYCKGRVLGLFDPC
jgi:hypothetical protein